MKRTIAILTITASIGLFAFCSKSEKTKWVYLFDGKTLNGWKAGTNASSFSVDSGHIVVKGPTAHLFYDGPVQNHDFKDFEFEAEVMTQPGANSGIYFHTAYQSDGWPSKGYEVQVNNSQSDWRRTGSLYNIQDVKEVYVKDREWFREYIRVEGKHVIIKINDKTVVDYTEPANPERPRGMEQRLISNGTFALQAHDPNSVIYYRNIRVRGIFP